MCVDQQMSLQLLALTYIAYILIYIHVFILTQFVSLHTCHVKYLIFISFVKNQLEILQS